MSGVSGVLDRVKSWLFAEETDGFEPFVEEEVEAPRKRKLIPLHSRAGEISSAGPETRTRRRSAWTACAGRRAVIVNLKDVPSEDALRVFDFLAGATYAVGGQIEQAGDKVYLVTPQSIGIMAEETLTQVTPAASFWQDI